MKDFSLEEFFVCYTSGMQRAVIFDFFGVFCPDITLEWFKKTVPDHQPKLEAFQAYCTESDYGRLSRKDFFEKVSALAGTDITSMEKGVEAQTVIDKELANYTRQLKSRGFPIACLSNGTREWTLRVINDHDLGELFDEVILSGDLGIVKPNPEIYKRALGRLNTVASNAIFVDDREVNVIAARELGIVGILFENTTSAIAQLQNLLDSSE